MSKSKYGSFFIIFVLIVLIFTSVFGISYIFSNSTSRKMSVKIYDKVIYNDSSNIIFDNLEPINFQVIGTDNYNIKIIPHVSSENDFSFKVNEEDVWFSYILDDMTFCFDITYYDDKSFDLDFRDNSLENVLSLYYPYYKISEVPTPKNNVSYFDLIIEDKESDEQITIALNSLMSIRVNNIELSDEVLSL